MPLGITEVQVEEVEATQYHRFTGSKEECRLVKQWIDTVRIVPMIIRGQQFIMDLTERGTGDIVLEKYYDDVFPERAENDSVFSFGMHVSFINSTLAALHLAKENEAPRRAQVLTALAGDDVIAFHIETQFKDGSQAEIKWVASEEPPTINPVVDRQRILACIKSWEKNVA